MQSLACWHRKASQGVKSPPPLPKNSQPPTDTQIQRDISMCVSPKDVQARTTTSQSPWFSPCSLAMTAHSLPSWQWNTYPVSTVPLIFLNLFTDQTVISNVPFCRNSSRKGLWSLQVLRGNEGLFCGPLCVLSWALPSLGTPTLKGSRWGCQSQRWFKAVLAWEVSPPSLWHLYHMTFHRYLEILDFPYS